MGRAPVLSVTKGTTYVTRPSLPSLREFVALLRPIWKTRVLTNNGPSVSRFEDELERYTQSRNVEVLSNGTLALEIAAKILFPSGATIATTPFTFPATTNALIWLGMKPRFFDIDPETFNLDPALVAQSDERSIDGILSVHVFGNPAGSSKFQALGRARGIPVLFDAAHALGFRARRGHLLERGDASTLSFHATKHFHSFEGGAIATRSPSVAREVRLLRNFGIVSEEEVEAAGINAKMTEIQAVMGLANLRHIDRWIGARKVRFDLYRSLLGTSAEIQHQRLEVGEYNYPYMPILLPSRRVRDRVFDALLRQRIRARKYFYPLTSGLPYTRKYARTPLPVATRVAEGILTLPLYADLPLREVRRISACVRSAIRDAGSR
jgi:dTDP-4-amino-4,6-dideoxygalactose transaminase